MGLLMLAHNAGILLKAVQCMDNAIIRCCTSEQKKLIGAYGVGGKINDCGHRFTPASNKHCMLTAWGCICIVRLSLNLNSYEPHPWEGEPW